MWWDQNYDLSLSSAIAKREQEPAPVLAKVGKLDRVGELLMAAADYIEKHGWCRHAARNQTGAVCMMGALLDVRGNLQPEYGLAIDRVRRACGGIDIVNWNDRLCSSKQAAAAVLRAAART